MGGKPTKIPIGIEKILFVAAEDSAFRQALFADREGALAMRGFRLRGSERAMLLAIPSEQLAAAIDGMNTSRTNVERRSFLQVVAASAMTIGAVNAVSCDSNDEPTDAVTGSRPDFPDGGKDGLTDGGPETSDGATDSDSSDLSDGVSDTTDVNPPGPDSAGIRPDDV